MRRQLVLLGLSCLIGASACKSPPEGAALAASGRVHLLKESLPGTRLVEVSLPLDLNPERVAVRIGGVYSLPYMGGEVWEHPHPASETYTLQLVVDEEVTDGAIILLDENVEIPFQMDLHAARYYWSIRMYFDEEKGQYNIRSAEFAEKGCI